MKLNHHSVGLVFIVAFLSMLGPFSIDTYLPSFPAIENEFSVNRALLSQTIAWYLVATAMAILFWGPLSDRIGRKAVILITLALYLLASLGCALATDYHRFLLARILQGVAASGGLVAGRAMIRDAHDSRGAHQAMSMVLMLFALAPAIAPIIGGWLHDACGWRSIFYFLAIYAAVFLLISMFFLDETLLREKRRSFHPWYVLGVYMQTLLHTEFLMLVLSLGTGFAGLFIYIAGSPTIMFEFLGLQSTDFAVQFVPMTLGIIVGSWLSGRLSEKWTKRRIIYLSFCIMFVASLFNLLQARYMSPTVFTVILPIVVYAFGVAMSMPAFSVLAIDQFPGNKGAAAAVQAFVQIIFSAWAAGGILVIIRQSLFDFALAQIFLLSISAGFWVMYIVARSAKNRAS